MIIMQMKLFFFNVDGITEVHLKLKAVYPHTQRKHLNVQWMLQQTEQSLNLSNRPQNGVAL